MCSIFLIKPQRMKTVNCVCSKEPAEASYRMQQSLTARHSTVYAAEKVNRFKQCFYRNNKMFCGINSYDTCSNAVCHH